MMKIKLNRVLAGAMAFLMMGAMAGCSAKSAADVSSGSSSAEALSTDEVGSDGADTEEKINVVATIFPQYDFIRQIAGDKVNLTMLLSPGAESHSYEPTPKDITNVQDADLFIYVGGDSDAWVDQILDAMDTENMDIVKMMDSVDLVEEETVEGMEAEEEEVSEEEEPEMDEHVWTSPKNAMLIVQDLCDELCKLDSEHADTYQENTEKYLADLTNLDHEFQDVVDNAKRTEIVVGDRFPFRYFVEEYGLTYYAAFPGCSTDTEASAATVAFLIDKVKEDEIPVVFHIELSNEQMCDSICEATGAKSCLLNAVHNISKDDFENGVTYLDLMEQNVDALKEALN